MNLQWTILIVHKNKDYFGWYLIVNKNFIMLRNVNNISFMSKWIREGEI
jgi:hypothetical protein